MTQTPIIATGLDLLKVKCLESGLPYSADSKMAGKTYSRFRYAGIVFIVPDHDDFVADFKAGKVKELSLIEGTRDIESEDDAGVKSTTTVKTLAFDAHISIAQYKGVVSTAREEQWEEAEFAHKIATLGKPVISEALLKALEEKILG